MESKVCSICDPKGLVNDNIVDSPRFSLRIRGNRAIYQYDGIYESDSGATRVNFCPECGRKLSK